MIVIASHNGIEGTRSGYEQLTADGVALDACVAGATVVEDDPSDMTVGYGGLPNEQGIVELDAAVMDGRTHRAGAVAGLRGIRHAAQVARLVMQQTQRVLLVGDGAREFALANGFAEEDLLTERARRMWLHWRRSRGPRSDWRPPDEEESRELDLQRYYREEFERGGGGPLHGTVHFAALDCSGDLACATSTAGHAFKLPGRVGDSPIVGAGLYVENEVGSCGCIGRGESTMENLTSFEAVRLMAEGRSPEEAGLEALRRLARRTAEHLCDEEGRPKFDLRLFLLTRDGAHAGVSIWGPKQYAVADVEAARLLPCVALYEHEQPQ